MGLLIKNINFNPNLNGHISGKFGSLFSREIISLQDLLSAIGENGLR